MRVTECMYTLTHLHTMSADVNLKIPPYTHTHPRVTLFYSKLDNDFLLLIINNTLLLLFVGVCVCVCVSKDISWIVVVGIIVHMHVSE